MYVVRFLHAELRKTKRRKESGMKKKEGRRADGRNWEDKEDKGRGKQRRVVRVGITMQRRKEVKRGEIIVL